MFDSHLNIPDRPPSLTACISVGSCKRVVGLAVVLNKEVFFDLFLKKAFVFKGVNIERFLVESFAKLS